MKIKILILSVFAMVLSSCAGFTHVTIPHSGLNFGEKDFEVRRHVEYTLQKTYVLGIGGMSAKARNTNIMKELLNKANLQQNEVLTYVTISRNVNFILGIVTEVRFTASGKVVGPTQRTDNVGTINLPAQSTEINTQDVIAYTNKDKFADEHKRGRQLKTLLKQKIVTAQTTETLLEIKKEIELHLKNGSLTSEDAKKLNAEIEESSIYINER